MKSLGGGDGTLNDKNGSLALIHDTKNRYHLKALPFIA